MALILGAKIQISLIFKIKHSSLRSRKISKWDFFEWFSNTVKSIFAFFSWHFPIFLFLVLARGPFPTDVNVSATTAHLPKAPTVHTPDLVVPTLDRPAQDLARVPMNAIWGFPGPEAGVDLSHPYHSQQFTILVKLFSLFYLVFC